MISSALTEGSARIAALSKPSKLGGQDHKLSPMVAAINLGGAMSKNMKSDSISPSVVVKKSPDDNKKIPSSSMSALPSNKRNISFRSSSLHNDSQKLLGAAGPQSPDDDDEVEERSISTNDEDSETSFYDDDTYAPTTSKMLNETTNVRQSSMPEISPSTEGLSRTERHRARRRASTGTTSGEAMPSSQRKNWRPLLKSNLEHSVTDVSQIENSTHRLMLNSIPRSPSLVSKLTMQWPPPSPQTVERSSVSGDSVSSISMGSGSSHRPEPAKLDVEVRWPPIPNAMTSPRGRNTDDETVLSEVKVKTRRETFELQEQETMLINAMREMDETEFRRVRLSYADETAEVEDGERKLHPLKICDIAKLEPPFPSSKLEDAGKEVDDLFRYGSLVLPSGQKLPKGSALIYKKKRRRKKKQRTNYRIRYDGPSFLDLNEIYGLPSVPEMDNRFGDSSSQGLRHPSRGSKSLSSSFHGTDDSISDSAPRMIQRRTSGGLMDSSNDQAPTPVLRRQSSGKITPLDSDHDFSPRPVTRRVSGDMDTPLVDDEDIQEKDDLLRRSSSDTSRKLESGVANDVAPKYSRRRSSREQEEGDENDNDQAPTYSRPRSPSCDESDPAISPRAGRTEPAARGISRNKSPDFGLDSEKDIPPAPPSRRQNRQHHESESDSENFDDDVDAKTQAGIAEADDVNELQPENDSTRNRPDVWITPIKVLADEDCKWKVKRVWYVESADADEKEISCLNDDLVDTIRGLLGVPGNENPEMQDGCRPPWHLKIYIDIDGEIEESGSEISLNEEDFRMEVKRMSEIAEAEEEAYDEEEEEEEDEQAVEDSLRPQSDHHSIGRSFRSPDQSDDLQGPSETKERKWKVKRTFTVDMHGNVLEDSDHNDRLCHDQKELNVNSYDKPSKEPTKQSKNEFTAAAIDASTGDNNQANAVAPAKSKTLQKGDAKATEVAVSVIMSPRSNRKKGLSASYHEAPVSIVVSPRTGRRKGISTSAHGSSKKEEPPNQHRKKGIKRVSKVKQSWNVIGEDRDDPSSSKRPMVWLQK